MTTTYQCNECGWEGHEDELGIASTDEGTHHYQCPECLGCEVAPSKTPSCLSGDVELKGEDDGQQTTEG